MTKPEQYQNQLNNYNRVPNTFVRVSMEPLYQRLLKKPFSDSVSAIEYCRSVCAEFGFTVKQEASANRNIYVYCSREGLPDSQRNPKPSPQRKRPSKRCDCRWRVVLSENDQDQWEFRKSMNPNASEHNHEMMSPDEMVKAWPPEVNEMIIELARQRLQTHEIREAVKQQFPDITWNERRFYNRLTEERKRIRQRGVVERSQRLLMLSARLCAMVASQEQWTCSVETDLQRLFENFCQLARLPFESTQNLIDLQPDLIQMDTDRLVSNTHRLSIHDLDQDEMLGSPAKKRKSINDHNGPEPQKGVQIVYVPSYTIQVHNLDNPNSQPAQPINLFALASPTSSSSSSSSVPFQQRQQQQQQQQQQMRVTSPPQSDLIMSQQQSHAGLTTYNLLSSTLPFQFDTTSNLINRNTNSNNNNFFPNIKQEQQESYSLQ